MLQETKEYIEKLDVFKPQDRLLVTVSGGVDSIVCLHILHNLGYICGVAHCNFQLRGSESDEDESFVRSMCKQLELPFYCQSFNTHEYASQKSLSIQMAARELRYSWFESLRLSANYDHIILAHHGDDSVETMLINLARGTGLKGLTGIQAHSGHIRRPILFANRRDILAYADENHLSFREDSSNSKTDYTRNRIRHIIIPEFEKINPSFLKTSLSSIRHLRQEQLVLDQIFAEIKKDIVRTESDDILLSLNKLSTLQHLNWFLFRFLSTFGFNGDQVSSLIDGISAPPGKQFFSEKYKIIIDREFLFLTQSSNNEAEESYISVGVNSISEPINLKFEVLDIQQHIISTNRDIADLNYNKLSFPLKLRKWISGDFFYPIGMKNAKKLSDFFIDEKIPRHKKNEVWLLCSGDDIVWIVGHRLDNRFKITKDTKTVYRVSKES